MDVLIGLYLFVLGTIFASFFGVIIDRVPRGQSIVKPSSRCDNCGHELKWYENIPLLSYLILGGKCSNCKSKIGSFFFIYELIGGLSMLFVFIKFGYSIECILISLITLAMLLIAGFDYKTNTILDLFIWILLILCLSTFGYRVLCLNYDYKPYIYSVILGLIFFISVKLIMSKILKKDALGSGDVILVTVLGLIVEPFEQLLAILVSSLTGSIITILLILLKKNQKSDLVPFCPYLFFGYYIVMLFGNYLTHLLLR